MSVADELTLSELLDIFSHSRRRFVLGYLDETGTEVPTDSLAERLVAWERATGHSDSATAAVDEVKLSLYHTHLPKLESAGIVAYDSTHVRSDAGETTLTDLPLDELLAEERDRMLANCC